jgi:hypothetical protein
MVILPLPGIACFPAGCTDISPSITLFASFGTGNSPGWLEEDLLGFGSANWTNSYDPVTTERLLRDAGLTPEIAEIVIQDEPTGPERWLYVLAMGPD